MSASTERERYIDWLRARGASEEDLAAHRVHAEKVLTCVDDGGPVQPADVDEAVEAERAAGAPEHRLGNLRRVGDYLMQFQRESPRFGPPKPEMSTADIELSTPVPRGGKLATPRPAPAPPEARASGGAGKLILVLAILLAVAAAAGLWFALSLR